MIYVLFVSMFLSSGDNPTYVDTYAFETEAECLVMKEKAYTTQYMPTEAVCRKVERDSIPISGGELVTGRTADEY